MTRKQVETSLQRGMPFGDAGWVKRMAKRLGVESTLRARGRPRKPLEMLSPRQRRRREQEQQRS